MRTGIWISTTTYSKSYLTVAWQQRHQLQDYERRGFAQFVYLTISAHLEGVITNILRRRYHSLRFMLPWEDLPPKLFKLEEQLHQCDMRPLYESLIRIIDYLEAESDSAPLGKLIERYNIVFSPSLRESIGTELAEDIEALGSLRNLFAHGRDFVLELKCNEPFDGTVKGNVDSSPVKKPAIRLHKAGIIKDMRITGQNHEEFRSVFFSDDALLYFYQAAQQIEEKLLEGSTFLPENHIFQFPKLPALDL